MIANQRYSSISQIKWKKSSKKTSKNRWRCWLIWSLLYIVHTHLFLKTLTARITSFITSYSLKWNAKEEIDSKLGHCSCTVKFKSVDGTQQCMFTLKHHAISHPLKIHVYVPWISWTNPVNNTGTVITTHNTTNTVSVLFLSTVSRNMMMTSPSRPNLRPLIFGLRRKPLSKPA